MEYPDAVDQFEKWVSTAVAKRPLHMEPNSVRERSGKQHLFGNVISWLAAHKLASSPTPYEEQKWDVVLTSGFTCDTFESIRLWLTTGLFAKTIFERYWLPFKTSLVQKFLDETRICCTTTMDNARATGQVDQTFLPFLMNVSLADLDKVAKDECDFSSTTSRTMLPRHVRRSILLRDFFSKTTCGSDGDALVIPGIQNTSLQCLPMIPADLLTLMHMFTVMHTGMLVSASVHALFFASDAKFVHPWRSPVSKSEEYGIKTQPLMLLETLEIALETLTEMGQTAAVIVLDAKGYSLKLSVSHCVQWVSQLEMFLKGCRATLVRQVAGELKEMASALDAALPRWDFVFVDQVLREDLAKERVLLHPKRSSINPLTKHVNATNKLLTDSAKEWGLEDVLVTSASFVASTSSTAQQYMTILAGLTTVVYHRNAIKAKEQAEEILKIVGKVEAGSAFKFPNVLRSILTGMSNGTDVSSMIKVESSAGAAATSEASASSTPSLPKAEAVETTSSGVQAASVAAASLAVKAEPAADKADPPLKKPRRAIRSSVAVKAPP